MAVSVRLNNKGGEEPVPNPLGRVGTIPLYVPKDTIRKVKLEDKRKMNPATNTPYKIPGGQTASADIPTLTAIIAHAKAKGIDPYTALAIAHQETKYGKEHKNLGSAWMTYPDEGITDELEQNANMLAKAIKEKLAYAKQLGFDKKGEEYALQAYNGYGKVFPRFQGESDSFYGIPITRNKPLNMRENPVYGRTIKSLRDEIIKKNPEIIDLVTNTPAYGTAPSTETVAVLPEKKASVKIRK